MWIGQLLFSCAETTVLGIVLKLWNGVGHIFGDYWLVVEIVLYWISSEFLTWMVSSQLVFNLLSSQECIHWLYHWEEWLPSLVWSRSGNSLHQHIKVGLLFDWWLWDLILQQRCPFSVGLVCHGYRNKATKRQTLSFSSWEMVEQSFLSKTLAVSVLSANRAWIKFTLVPSSWVVCLHDDMWGCARANQ